nr:MAG TPA: hypothetical protein [Caudoviricetes sp.]
MPYLVAILTRSSEIVGTEYNPIAFKAGTSLRLHSTPVKFPRR